MQLRTVDIENAIINMLDLQKINSLKLEGVKMKEIRLPTRLEGLKYVSLHSVTMLGSSSWNTFFQILRSPPLTQLKVKNVDIDDTTINLENGSGLERLELEHVKIKEIRLPTRLEELKYVILESVTMPESSSWNTFFQILQTPPLTQLKLKKLDIDDTTINLENGSGLERLELEHVKIKEIRLPTRLEGLKYVILESVTMQGSSSWNTLIQILQSPSLTQLELKKLDIDDTTINLENGSGLQWLKLEHVKMKEIRLPTRLEGLKYVILESVTMQGSSSWNTLFQILQTPSLTQLELKKLDINDTTINLENSSGLERHELEHVKMKETRLPSRLEGLKYVILESVTMPGSSSWNTLFQILQTPSLTQLKLKKLDIDDTTINLENGSGLERLELEHVKMKEIRLTTRLEGLKYVTLESVTMPGSSSWNTLFQILQTPSLTQLKLKKLDIDDTTINLENGSGLERLELEHVKIKEIRLPTRLEGLKYVILESVTMQGSSSWNTLIQILQSPSLTQLELKKLDIDDTTINLENGSGLEGHELEHVKMKEIRLPTRLEGLKYVILESVTMPGSSSWNTLFQILQSPSLTQLELKKLDINDTTINLENGSGLQRLELEHVKIKKIRLPTRLEELKDVTLESLTIPESSWNTFFQILQSPSLTERILKNLDIDKIKLPNCKSLNYLQISNMNLAEIHISSTERLFAITADKVALPESQASSFFNQVLLSTNLRRLTMEDISLGEETVWFDRWACHLQSDNLRLIIWSAIRIKIQLKNVTMSQESYECLCKLLKAIKFNENRVTKHSIDRGLLNVSFLGMKEISRDDKIL